MSRKQCFERLFPIAVSDGEIPIKTVVEWNMLRGLLIEMAELVDEVADIIDGMKPDDRRD